MASRLRDLHIAWLLPVLVFALSVAALLWSAWQRRHVSDELDQMYRVHVASVSRLIREGARQASASIELIYALSEQRLADAVREVNGLGPTVSDVTKRIEAAGLSVWVTGNEDAGFVGAWGPIAEPARLETPREVLKAEPGEIVETESLRALNLYCAYFALEKHSKRAKVTNESGRDAPRSTIACQRADELVALRREIGVGPLLREVARRGVVYAAIQDISGILAASSNVTLSSWSSDPELGRAFDRAGDALSFRLVKAPPDLGDSRSELAADMQTPPQLLFEGLGRFSLPDGSDALLRVGIDASYLMTARADLERREHFLWILVGLVLILSIFGAALVSRWDRRRERVERLLAAREQESRWLQLMAQMAATVAHEVRSPLNTIQMIAQRLAIEFKLPEANQKEYRELVDLLRGESDRVDKVVSEFVELGRPIVLSFETVACRQALEQALMPLQLRVASEGKSLVVEAPDDPVRLDLRRFGQIVANLVSNALDAIGPNGSVHVSARCYGGDLHLLVEDDGVGMNAEQLEQAQRPFVTSKAKGTGLGLPLAIRLAEAHGGKLTLSSIAGRGTKAELVIPYLAQ